MQGIKGVIAAVNVHELVHIQRQYPIGLFDQLVLGGLFERGELYPAFVIGAVIADVGDVAQLLQPVEHGVGAVLTAIGEDQKIVESHSAMMGEPFQQEGRLVSHTQDCKVGHYHARLKQTTLWVEPRR